MAIASNDRLLVQRSGALRSIECEDINNLQSGDLLVVQRSSGMGNLRKIDWANKDTDLQDADMMFVSDVSTAGNTLKKTTWGVVKTFLNFPATILASGNGSSSNRNLTLDDLFTPAELLSTIGKKITIEAGAKVGGNTAGGSALDISSTNPVNGAISIINNGQIVGRQGGLFSANGGTAISFSKNATVVNNGTISGGGGQGGTGGTGGNGSTTTSLGAGNGSTTSCDASCTSTYGSGTFCEQSTINCTPLDILRGLCNPGGGITGYNCSSNQSNCTPLDILRGLCVPQNICNNCIGTSTTTGGAGGAGGFGAGFTSSNTNVSFSSGSSGVAGGTNAGTGGTGGTGGGHGLAGSTGSTGGNGTVSNGSAGSSGGTGGVSIAKNSNTVTVTNNGTIDGSITT